MEKINREDIDKLYVRIKAATDTFSPVHGSTLGDIFVGSIRVDGAVEYAEAATRRYTKMSNLRRPNSNEIEAWLTGVKNIEFIPEGHIFKGTIVCRTGNKVMETAKAMMGEFFRTCKVSNHSSAYYAERSCISSSNFRVATFEEHMDYIGKGSSLIKAKDESFETIFVRTVPWHSEQKGDLFEGTFKNTRVLRKGKGNVPEINCRVATNEEANLYYKGGRSINILETPLNPDECFKVLPDTFHVECPHDSDALSRYLTHARKLGVPVNKNWEGPRAASRGYGIHYNRVSVRNSCPEAVMTIAEFETYTHGPGNTQTTNINSAKIKKDGKQE